MTTTSREYAEALFELAVQGNVTEETSEGLETVISALMQTPEYKAMLASPAIGKEERLNALDSAFRGKIPDILLAIRCAERNGQELRGTCQGIPRRVRCPGDIRR